MKSEKLKIWGLTVWLKPQAEALRIRRLAETKGFTLIELLVVISIIGILASLTLVSYSGAQKQTRDTQRRSDLAQYRNGLENFAAANNGMYPAYSTRQEIKTTSSNFCTILKLNYISSCPLDPIGGTNFYNYRSDGIDDGTPKATKYVLWVKLEAGDYWWEVCSDGRSGKLTTSPATGGGDNGGSCQLP